MPRRRTSPHRNLARCLRYSPVEAIQSPKWLLGAARRHFPALTLPGSVRFSPAAMYPPIAPVLPTGRKDLPAEKHGWARELKLDGFRGMADTINGRMLSKNLTPPETITTPARCPTVGLRFRWGDLRVGQRCKDMKEDKRAKLLKTVEACVLAVLLVAVLTVGFYHAGEMSRSLLNIEKRSLPRLMLSGVGLASKDAV
jgi:hypothetical protein